MNRLGSSKLTWSTRKRTQAGRKSSQKYAPGGRITHAISLIRSSLGLGTETWYGYGTGAKSNVNFGATKYAAV